MLPRIHRDPSFQWRRHGRKWDDVIQIMPITSRYTLRKYLHSCNSCCLNTHFSWLNHHSSGIKYLLFMVNYHHWIWNARTPWGLIGLIPKNFENFPSHPGAGGASSSKCIPWLYVIWRRRWPRRFHGDKNSKFIAKKKHGGGSIEIIGYPNSEMVYFMENPSTNGW